MDTPLFSKATWPAILEKVTNGEDTGFEELYRELDGLRQFLYARIGRDRGDDAYHETIIALVAQIRRGEIRDPERLAGYARTIAFRRAVDLMREAGHVVSFESLEEWSRSASSMADSPEEEAIQNEREHIAKEVLLSLKERDRKVLIAYYLDGECPEAIQAALGLSPAQFRLIKSRAKQKYAELCQARMKRPTREYGASAVQAKTKAALQRLGETLRLPVELIYDSFLAPAPVGLRATWQSGWQGLYRAGDWSVDLRIEPELKSPVVTVVGQILNYVNPSLETGDIPVSLKTGGTSIAETRSNHFGEFQLKYDRQQRPHLDLRVDGGTKLIELPLKALGIGQPTGTEGLTMNLKDLGSKERPTQARTGRGRGRCA